MDVYRPRSLFQIKAWGMGTDMQVWWSLDFGRYSSKRNAIVIETQGCCSWPSIGMMPNNGELDTVNFIENKLKELCPTCRFEYH